MRDRRTDNIEQAVKLKTDTNARKQNTSESIHKIKNNGS